MIRKVEIFESSVYDALSSQPRKGAVRWHQRRLDRARQESGPGRVARCSSRLARGRDDHLPAAPGRGSDRGTGRSPVCVRRRGRAGVLGHRPDRPQLGRSRLVAGRSSLRPWPAPHPALDPRLGQCAEPATAVDPRLHAGRNGGHPGASSTRDGEVSRGEAAPDCRHRHERLSQRRNVTDTQRRGFADPRNPAVDRHDRDV